jgi:hypothetical protein
VGTYTTEDFVRRTVSQLLRGKYRGGVVCAACLVGMTLERLHTGWRKSEIEHVMAGLFKTPGTLRCLSAGPCARCRRPDPSIGEHPS